MQMNEVASDWKYEFNVATRGYSGYTDAIREN